MARPIEATPDLYGEDAERLERQVANPCSLEEQKRRAAAAEAFIAEMSRPKGRDGRKSDENLQPASGQATEAGTSNRRPMGPWMDLQWEGTFQEIVSAYIAVRDASTLADEFEAAISTVSRWASGHAQPRPRMQREVVSWITKQLGAQIRRELTEDDMDVLASARFGALRGQP